MPHVFISYVREDATQVDRLAADLRSSGVHVWTDRERIYPGQAWRTAIENAIQTGAFFLACFSENYYLRDHTYMDEEIDLALAEMERRPLYRGWFIPVRLDTTRYAPRSRTLGEALDHLQWADLATNWSVAVAQIAAVVTGVGGKIPPTLQQPTSNDIALNSERTISVLYMGTGAAHRNFDARIETIIIRWLTVWGFKVSPGYWSSASFLAKIPRNQVDTIYVIYADGNYALASRLETMLRDLKIVQDVIRMHVTTAVYFSMHISEADLLTHADALIAVRPGTA